MALTPQTIGLNMSHGFSGSYARQPDMIVNTAPLGGTEIIPFGTPLVRGENGAVLPMGTGNTGNQFIGVAGREIKSPAEFFSQSVGQYAPEEAVSVFQRGCINVKCQKGSPTIDGTVYVRVAASGSYVVGGFEAEADGTNTVALSNAQWNGPSDNNGVAGLRIAYVGPSYTLPDATTSVRGGALQMAAIADLSAAPTQQDFNNLLAALRTAGMLRIRKGVIFLWD